MPKPLHPKRHATALRIAAALGRAERAAAGHPVALAALKELHLALADGVAAHGAELGLAPVEQYSAGLPK